MPKNQTVSLSLAGRAGERNVLLWTSDSGLPLPMLRPDSRYRLIVYNGPHLVYACAPETAEFVLGRLLELLDHTPGKLFTACHKCQALIALGREPEPWRPDSDPVVRELETLNSGLDETTRTHAWLVKLLGQAEADQMLAVSHPAIAKAKAEFEAMIAKARPEPDRTTPARYIAPDQTTPAALTRDEMTALDDLVFRSCEGWSDLHRAKFYLQLNALGVNLEWAKNICRKEEAKVGK